MTMVHPIAESDAAIPEKLLITTIIVSVMDAWCGLMLMILMMADRPAGMPHATSQTKKT